MQSTLNCHNSSEHNEFQTTGFIYFNHLTNSEKAKLDEIRRLYSLATKFDYDLAKPLSNRKDIKRGETVLINGRYAKIKKTNHLAAEILIDADLSYSILKVHLYQVVKKLPTKIPVNRVLGKVAERIDKSLCSPVIYASELSIGQHVLISKEGHYRYARISKICNDHVFVGKRRIHKDLLAMSLQKIPRISKTKLKSKKIYSCECPLLKEYKPTQEKHYQSQIKAEYGLVEYNSKIFKCSLNEKTGNLVLDTPFGKLEVDPIFVKAIDIKSNNFIDTLCEIYEDDKSNTPTLHPTISQMRTQEKKLFLRIEKRMQDMGISNNYIIKESRRLLRECYSQFDNTKKAEIFIARIAVNIIGDARFTDAYYGKHELEGLPSLETIFYFWHMLQAYHSHAKYRNLFSTYPSLSGFLRKLINLQEKLLISSLMTECARMAHDQGNERKRNEIINYIIRIFREDVLRVFEGRIPEAGFWTFGFRGHFVIIHYKRESKQNMLRFSLQQVGLGSEIAHKQLPGKRIINEFRLGNRLIEKKVKDQESNVIATGYACDKEYIESVLFKKIIPEIVRIKVYGTQDEFIDWLEKLYQKQKVFDNSSAFLRTGVSQKSQLIGNCVAKSHEAAHKKLAKDAKQVFFSASFKHFVKEQSLKPLSSLLYPKDRIQLGVVTDNKTKSLKEIIQICWENYIALSKVGKNKVYNREPPHNQTLGIPLNPYIEIDIKEFMGTSRLLVVMGKDSAPQHANARNAKILIFDEELAPKNLGLGIFTFFDQKLIFNNIGSSIIKVEKESEEIIDLHRGKSIPITGKSTIRLNLAPDDKKGFWLTLKSSNN